ncbi:conserved hypothetical protein [Burkholderiales bacterium 8X]|nr:conserved hypothetical protein [Burkholderiales bacterium 8X]
MPRHPQAPIAQQAGLATIDQINERRRPLNPADEIPPMKAIVLAAIRFYQRAISPSKGFGCAHRVHRGSASCSALGLRAVRRYGVLKGMAVLRLRLGRCSEVYREAHPPRKALMRRAVPPLQRGSCEVPCDLHCDAPGGRLLEVCDCLDCGSCGSRRREKPSEPRRTAKAITSRRRSGRA